MKKPAFLKIFPKYYISFGGACKESEPRKSNWNVEVLITLFL
jgi:hypothetical protein